MTEDREKIIEQLKEYRVHVASLTEEEKKQRDLYLKRISNGEIQGPSTGFSSLDKPWLKNYSDQAILADIPEMTAYQYLRLCNKDNKKLCALNFFGLKTSYEKLFQKIEQTSKSLTALGVKKGDVVLINSVTLPQTVYLLYALNQIGAIANLTDLRTDANGMKHYINEANSRFIFTLDSCYDGFKDIISETNLEKIIFLNPTDEVPLIAKKISEHQEQKKMSSSEKEKVKQEHIRIENYLKTNPMIIKWNDFYKIGDSKQPVIESEYEQDQPIVIVHTSGTTSMPKSVVLTNENFNAMALQYSMSGFDYQKGDSVLNIIPIFVAYGVVNSLHMPLCLGMTDIVYPKVVNDDFTDIIRKFKPNHVIAIPMHWEFLLKDEKMKKFDLSFLKTSACGGDSFNVELEKQLNKFLEEHNAKSKIVKGYGMTEVSACAVTNTNKSSEVGTVGIPMVKNNIAIIDPETGSELRYGEKGEICISTPTMMREYLNNEDETSKTIKTNDYGERWLYSGDMGHYDTSLSIDGRYKRLIIRRGFKVSAKAIENVIMKNTHIENCAVVKAPDIDDGEIPFVYLVLKEKNVDINNIIVEIKALCQKELPEYYLPSQFIVVNTLPYTKNNKLDLVRLESEAIRLINENCEDLIKNNMIKRG